MIVRLLLCVKPDGEKMPDGTIYAGKSPHSGKRLFTTAADAPPLMTFENAVPLHKNSEMHGHKDWRLPTPEELKMLFNNRAEIGEFTTERGHGLGHWHWSCTVHRQPSTVWVVVFERGTSTGYKDSSCLSARAVRAEP